MANKMVSKTSAKEIKDMTNFFFELGQLKRVKRSGWWLININDPENVAEHSHRAAAIGFVMAKLDGADANKTAMMCLFNDLHEARINDLHKVGQRYIDFKQAETKAHKEQMENLPKEIGNDIFGLHEEFQQQKTKESIIARDADLLENALQAKEYIEAGYKDAQNWNDNIRKVLKTKTAFKFLDQIEKSSCNDWWRSLKKITR